MKGKTILVVIVAIAATAAATYVGTRAISGTVAGGRSVSASTDAAPGEIESKGEEVTTLLSGFDESRGEEAVSRSDRDPLVKYSRPAPPPQKTEPTEPARPTFKVTAVVLDEDPTAILRVGNESVIVSVGEEVGGGRVIAIESDGVTIEYEDGSRKYPYPSS